MFKGFKPYYNSANTTNTTIANSSGAIGFTLTNLLSAPQ